jgi:hypothetical protein
MKCTIRNHTVSVINETLTENQQHVETDTTGFYESTLGTTFTISQGVGQGRGGSNCLVVTRQNPGWDSFVDIGSLANPIPIVNAGVSQTFTYWCKDNTDEYGNSTRWYYRTYNDANQQLSYGQLYPYRQYNSQHSEVVPVDAEGWMPMTLGYDGHIPDIPPTATKLILTFAQYTNDGRSSIKLDDFSYSDRFEDYSIDPYLWFDDMSLRMASQTAAGSSNDNAATAYGYGYNDEWNPDYTYQHYLDYGHPENEYNGGQGDNIQNGQVQFNAIAGTTYYFMVGPPYWYWDPIEYNVSVNLYFTPS